MKWLFNLKIGTKIVSGFILVAIISVAVGVVGYNGMMSNKEAQDHIATVYLPSVYSLLTISEAQTAVDSSENALLAEELVGKDRLAQYDRINAAFQRADEARKIYLQLCNIIHKKRS